MTLLRSDIPYQENSGEESSAPGDTPSEIVGAKTEDNYSSESEETDDNHDDHGSTESEETDDDDNDNGSTESEETDDDDNDNGSTESEETDDDDNDKGSTESEETDDDHDDSSTLSEIVSDTDDDTDCPESTGNENTEDDENSADSSTPTIIVYLECLLFDFETNRAALLRNRKIKALLASLRDLIHREPPLLNSLNKFRHRPYLYPLNSLNMMIMNSVILKITADHFIQNKLNPTSTPPKNFRHRPFDFETNRAALLRNRKIKALLASLRDLIHREPPLLNSLNKF
ncbi:hypothetical protein FOZ63_026100, partial [Perkinsus olseni]